MLLSFSFSSPEPTILLACGRNRELWEQPFQACAIDADCVKPDGQNSLISFVISKWLLVKGNEDSGNEIVSFFTIVSVSRTDNFMNVFNGVTSPLVFSYRCIVAPFLHNASGL